MILLYTIISLFLICGYILYKTCKTTKEFIGCIPGYCVFGSVSGVLLYAVISLFLYNILPQSLVPDMKYNIVSMSNNSSIEGSFILGTGSIRNERYYFYKVQHDDGGIKEFSAPIHQSIIYETNEQPKMERYNLELSKKITYIVNPVGVKSYKFFVPKDTVIKEFNIK